MRVRYRTAAIFLAALACVSAAGAATQAQAQPRSEREALIRDYYGWLDRGRVPAFAVTIVRAESGDFRELDTLADAAPQPVRPGDRLLFVNRGRTALLVVVGKQPLASAGARLIAAHIDTPTPRVDLSKLSNANTLTVPAYSYGGIRPYHWLNRLLALVGTVARQDGSEVEISVGLTDDLALYATERKERQLTILLGSGQAEPESRRKAGAKPAPRQSPAAAPTLLGELKRRYGLSARDLETAEVYVVPKERARDVGLDRALIGGHGQDDRVNSYVAWRAIRALSGTPERTAMVWLVDREEEGSYHVAGAQSQFLERVFAYLVAAQGGSPTELELSRALGATEALSADTPPALNPNWQEVHDPKNVPHLGRGPALFAFTGRGGKQGGSIARAELIRLVMSTFAAAGAPLQFGQIGRVDEGGGGSVARYLGERGMDVVDIGIAVVSMHSPLELAAKDDLWAAYLGYRAWLAQ